eukprot:9472822-Pyramimonas_sp.AAC.2
MYQVEGTLREWARLESAKRERGRTSSSSIALSSAKDTLCAILEPSSPGCGASNHQGKPGLVSSFRDRGLPVLQAGSGT